MGVDGNTPDAPRLQTEKSFFILNLESAQLCPSPVLPHAISAQNCAEFEVKHKSNVRGPLQIVDPFKCVDPFKSWYLETRSDPEMENRQACGKHFSGKDSTKIWNGLYCITWNTILRIPDPESKTISRDSGVGRQPFSSLSKRAQLGCERERERELLFKSCLGGSRWGWVL